MNLATAMAELGAALDTIDGLRVYDFPPGHAQTPAAIVAFPDSVDYTSSYQRGMDRITIPLIVLVGRVSDRASATELAAYLDGSGSSSVKAVVDGYGSYTEADDVTVTSAEVDVYTIGGEDFVTAIFDVELTGSGT